MLSRNVDSKIVSTMIIFDIAIFVVSGMMVTGSKSGMGSNAITITVMSLEVTIGTPTKISIMKLRNKYYVTRNKIAFREKKNFFKENNSPIDLSKMKFQSLGMRQNGTT